MRFHKTVKKELCVNEIFGITRIHLFMYITLSIGNLKQLWRELILIYRCKEIRDVLIELYIDDPLKLTKPWLNWVCSDEWKEQKTKKIVKFAKRGRILLERLRFPRLSRMRLNRILQVTPFLGAARVVQPKLEPAGAARPARTTRRMLSASLMRSVSCFFVYAFFFASSSSTR